MLEPGVGEFPDVSKKKFPSLVRPEFEGLAGAARVRKVFFLFCFFSLNKIRLGHHIPPGRFFISCSVGTSDMPLELTQPRPIKSHGVEKITHHTV